METVTPAELSATDTEPDSLGWLTPVPAGTPDTDDPELNITCRTKSALAAVPDIVSQVLPLLVIDGQTLEVNFLLNANHRFVPGQAPQTCSVSIDDIIWLQGRSMNLFQVDFPSKEQLAMQNQLRARLKFQRFGVPIVFAFRLKYREGPATPRKAKKVVLLATIMPNSRVVTLSRA
jgi:hypothetical protein